MRDTPYLVDLLVSKGVTELVVASTGTVYSNSFLLPQEAESKFALEYQFDSPGAVDVKIQLEQGNSLPATEGAADDNFVVPSGLSDIVTQETGEKLNLIAFSPVPTRYARIKFTGAGSNNALTKLTRLRVGIAR